MVRRTAPTPEDVRSALDPLTGWLAGDEGADPPRPAVAAAVRASARLLAAQHPGGALELRVPPYVAVQCLSGLNHRRGTPPNVVELDARTWLRLATGRLAWSQAVADGAVLASGSRADLADVLPMLGVSR